MERRVECLTRVNYIRQQILIFRTNMHFVWILQVVMNKLTPVAEPCIGEGDKNCSASSVT